MEHYATGTCANLGCLTGLVLLGLVNVVAAPIAMAEPQAHGEAQHEERGRRGDGNHGGFREGGSPGWTRFGAHGWNGRDEGRHLGWDHRGGSGREFGFEQREFGTHYAYAGLSSDWIRGGWHGGGPFLAYAGGAGVWDWRSAWGGAGWGIYPDVAWARSSWAWGGIPLGFGVSLVIAPPVVVLPPPIYNAPPPVVLALPAIAPPPLLQAVLATDAGKNGGAEVLVGVVPDVAAIVAAAVPPPIVISPPPDLVTRAGPPPLVFAPPAFAFAIAPPELEFAFVGPQYYTGGFMTGGYIARGFYGAAWEQSFYVGSVYRARGRGARFGGFFGLGSGPAFGGYGWHGGDRPFGGEEYRYTAREDRRRAEHGDEGRHEGWKRGGHEGHGKERD